jgi:hypothetical protein
MIQRTRPPEADRFDIANRRRNTGRIVEAERNHSAKGWGEAEGNLTRRGIACYFPRNYVPLRVCQLDVRPRTTCNIRGP